MCKKEEDGKVKMKNVGITAVVLVMAFLSLVIPRIAEGEEELKSKNIVKNGGFEKGLEGWHNWWRKGGKFKIDRDMKYSGKASLRIEGEFNSKVGVAQYLNLKPNTRYRLKYVIKTKEVVTNPECPWARVAGAGITVWTGEKALFLPRGTRAFIGTNRWVSQGEDFETTELKEGHRYYIHMHIIGASGTAWFDDVVIEEIKEDQFVQMKKK